MNKKKGVFIFTLIIILLTNIVGASVFLDNLVLMLHFENNTNFLENQTNIYDWSGNGNNGTFNGSIYNSTGGRFGGAFQYNGVNDSIVIKDSPSLDLGSNLTLSLWINLKNFTYNGSLSKTGLIEKGDSYQIMAINDDFPAGLAMNLPGIKSSDPNVINLNQWQHIVVTHDDNNINFYVNGENVGTKSAIFVNQSNKNLVIGRYYVDDYPLNGTIDEVLIWNRTLNNNEVSQLYDLVTAGLIISKYKFNNETLIGENQSLINDYSGFGNNLSCEINSTVNWCPNYSSSVGKNNGSLIFDGIDDYLYMSHSYEYEIMHEGTISLWINLTGNVSQNNYTILSKDSLGYNSGGHFSLQVKNGSFFSTINDVSSSYNQTYGSVLENQLYHIAYTFGNNGNKLYVDGIKVNESAYTGGMQGNEEYLVIGASLMGSGNSINYIIY